MASLGLEHHTVDGVTNNPGEKHDEGVHDTLNQGEGDHIPVGDVSDFMGQHGAHLALVETAQQACAHRHQRFITVPAGGKRVSRI